MFVYRLRQNPKGQFTDREDRVIHVGVSKRTGSGALREILTRISSFSKTEEKGTCDGNVDRERLNFYFDYKLGL